MNHHVVIVGAGAIGRAIERLIQDKAIRLELWDKDPTKVENQKELRDIIPSAEVVFLCVPSWSLREAITTIKPLLSDKTIIVGLSKGLESQSNYRIDQIVDELLPNNPFVLLSGPMLARLIQEDKPSYASIAATANHREALESIELLFLDTNLSLHPVNDVTAAALGGILKNIYAMVLGIVDGLEYGNNTKGWIVALSVREMQTIADRLNTNSTIMPGIAGLADLIATGFSSSSNNHRVGRELVLHGQTDLKSEGLVSLPSLLTLLNGNTESLPLLHTLNEAINNQQQTAVIFEAWLKNYSKQGEE